ncbi:hypothetical protein ASJ79_22100 [Mycobacterium sp. NAZ190054]|nr:hypothetical protein ASJ79_22100 [Mycobacterium sp. NAZ190054]
MQRRELRITELPEPVSHYTDAVTCGDFAFISGMIAMGTDGKVIGENDVVAQTEVVLDYLALALEAANSSIADIVKVTVFVTDINDRAAINTVRQRRFGANRPASTLVEISALVVPEAKVEIEAIAVIRS